MRVGQGLNVIYVVAMYRPHIKPIMDFSADLTILLQNDMLANKEIVLAGDLNIDLLKQDDSSMTDFVTSLQSLSFFPVITKPTRFPSGNQKGNPSILDHIWCNNLSHFSSGILFCDVTDHCPLFYRFVRPIGNNSNKIKLSFRSHNPGNTNKFIEMLSLKEWSFPDLRRYF